VFLYSKLGNTAELVRVGSHEKTMHHFCVKKSVTFNLLCKCTILQFSFCSVRRKNLISYFCKISDRN